MKKILFLLLTAISIGATAQQVVSTTVKFNNNVTFNDSTFGNPSKVPVTIFEDTIRYTRGAGAGKILASDANGNAYWTNVVLVDTFSGTPVFPSGIKTDTIFTTGGTTTGQVLILINDTTGVFANAPFVDTIYRLTGKDSIFYVIDGRTHAIKDSVGSSGGADNWTDSAGAIFPTVLQNNVGIGTATPTARFAVNFGDSVVQRIDSFGYEYVGSITAQCPSCTTAYFINSVAYSAKAVVISGTSDNNVGSEILGTSTDGVGLSLSGGSTTGAGVSFNAAGTTGMDILSTGTSNYGLRIEATAGNVDSAAIWLNSNLGKIRITGNGEGNGKVLTSDAAGNATWQSSDALFTVDSVATTGDTVDLATNTYTAIIASGAITDLALRFPASPANGDVVVAKFDFAVTTLTSDGQGKTIYGFPSSTALGQHREWRYDATTGAWY